MRATFAALLLALHSLTPMAQTLPEDPHLWLEDVQGERALAWVRERNAHSRAQLQQHPRFAAMRDGFKAILDSRERIPDVVHRGGFLYNFWRDAANPRGLWRRTTLASFQTAAPQWDVLLDLDALAKAESENWVWAGATCLGPSYRRCLLQLSRGGADAKVVREFDVAQRRFVAGGFTLPEAKSDVGWLDDNTLLVATDTGAGSLTDSGYPRQIRRWKRGQPLAAAPLVYEAQPADVAAFFSIDPTPGYRRVVVGRYLDFHRSWQHLLVQGQPQRLAVPDDAEAGYWRRWLLIRLKSDWAVGGSTYKTGSLLATDARAFMAGQRKFSVLFEPGAGRSLDRWSATASHVLLDLLDNVAGKLEEWRPPARGGAWQRREVAAPSPGRLSVQPLHDPQVPADPLAEAYLLHYADFLTPDSLMLGRTGSDERRTLKARPAFFDATGMRAEQHFATSADGTRVPYFVVWPQGAQANGDNPTVLYGYGGFEVSQQPWYSAAYGSAWYGQGGVLVVANIRGGGEFGPAWHQAAVKQHKQKSYDDFIAVAQDLVARKITRPARLGIVGGSNGGLLVGAVMLQRPDLFGAVVCQVPLLDMRRYHKLLAGASWMAEYGDPDKPEEWAWISKYSPYQNVQPGMKLPQVLLTTSTRDDRVHPGHARKMAARLAEQGHPVLYYENIEGGHGGAADNAQRADLLALEFAFMWQVLGAGR